MTETKTTSHFLEFDRMPDLDHKVMLALGENLMQSALAATDETARKEKESRAKTTFKSRGYAYRLLLACIAKNDAELLRRGDLASRCSPQTIAWLVEAHEGRLAPFSVASHLRNLIGFFRTCAPLEDDTFLRRLAQKFEAKAKTEESHKKSYAIKRSELPAQFQDAAARLEALGSDDYARGFRQYLGAQKAAGVKLAEIEVSFLSSSEAIANFEKIIPANENVDQRLNILGCALKKADLDARPIFDRASEIRQAASKNPGLYWRRACEFEELPGEVKARIHFATSYDGKASFPFEGQEIVLPKAYRRDGKEFSPNHIEAMQMALRHHYTILRVAGSLVVDDFMRWGEREAIDAFQQFYADEDFVTQISRLEELIAALRAIFGDKKRQMFVRERGQITLMHGLSKLLDDDDLGFDLRAAGKLRDDFDGLAVDPPSTRKLRARARAIARKALARLRDLQKSPLPYRDLQRLATLFRTALIVAFLAEIPPRLRTLAALTNDHLKKLDQFKIKGVAPIDPCFELQVPGSLTKVRKPFNYTLSPELTRLFDCWNEHVRPVLLSGRPDVAAVFISDEGLPLSRSAFKTSLPAFTAAFFAFRINVHLFRALHGTELIGDHGAAAHRLQHHDIQSQERYQDAAALRDQDRTTSLKGQGMGFFK